MTDVLGSGGLWARAGTLAQREARRLRWKTLAVVAAALLAFVWIANAFTVRSLQAAVLGFARQQGFGASTLMIHAAQVAASPAEADARLASYADIQPDPPGILSYQVWAPAALRAAALRALASQPIDPATRQAILTYASAHRPTGGLTPLFAQPVPHAPPEAVLMAVLRRAATTASVTAAFWGRDPVVAAPLVESGRAVGLVAVIDQEPPIRQVILRSLYATLHDNLRTEVAAVLLALLVLLFFMEVLVVRPIQRAASHDAMCGVLNQISFWNLLHRFCLWCQRRSVPLSLVVFDLDHFKALNDTQGHPAGDEALCRVADVVRTGVRPGDLVGRVGGEEFAILLVGCPTSEAFWMADRIRRRVGEIQIGGRSLSVSFGLSGSDTSGYDPEYMAESADQALYRAKNTGRDRGCIWRGSPLPSGLEEAPDGAPEHAPA